MPRNTINNMFNSLTDNVGGDGLGDINGQLVLVEVIAALTNYHHAPHNRIPMPHLPSDLMDEMVLTNRQGMLTETELGNYSAHMGQLNTMPSGEALVAGGFQEPNKGLMCLKFKIQKGGLNDEYVSVLGFITNNESQNGGISGTARFVPQVSWVTRSQMLNRVDDNGSPLVTEMVGRRSDYLLNDGSHGQNEGLTSMRPSDVITASADEIASQDVFRRLADEGIDTSEGTATPTLGAGSINHVGLVCSNRSNVNMSKYANKLLKSSVKASQQLLGGYVDDNGNATTDSVAPEMNILSDMSKELTQGEYRPTQDEFMEAMKDINGSVRNLRGFTIEDIAYIFPNFEDELLRCGCTMLDSSQFEVIDFTEIAEVFGRSSNVEKIAQELIFNILDLLFTHRLYGLEINGSNCDAMATEDRLSNIVMIPVDIKSLANNDFNTFQSGVNLCEDLKYQIFNRLNGANLSGFSPLRFKIIADMFGTTEIWLTSMSGENEGMEVYYSFPTFATVPYSPVMGSLEDLNQISKSVYGNIKSYFLED